MFEGCLTISVLLVLTIIYLIYLYLSWNFNYWTKRGVNGPKPKLLCGTFPSMITGKRNMYYDMLEIYEKFKTTEKIVGVFTVREPELLVLDPGLAHEVYVTKFKYFNENALGICADKKIDKLFGNNPFVLAGDEWKEMRNEVVPALTANRVKASYPIMQKTAEKLITHIENHNLIEENKVFDAKLLFSRFTVETVSDCIFGIEAGAFNEKTESAILNASKNIIDEFVSSISYFFICSVLPFLKFFRAPRFFSEKTDNFFINLTQRAIKLRSENQTDRSDFLNYVLQLSEKKNLDSLSIASKVMTFFTDGFETSALLITNCCLMLGRNKHVQEKLLEEINNNLDTNGNLNFESINELPYLDACVQETLRLIAPVNFSSKRCSESIELDNNGQSIKIQKGMVVHIPIQCFHTDKDLYDNADKFIPERFLEENQAKKYRDEGKFFPFGDGPRICLGMKFGVTQSKVAICSVLRNFEIIADKKTRNDNYLENQDMIPMIKGGVWLKFNNFK